MKVCDKTCILFFFPIINKYFLMAKRSLLSRCPSYNHESNWVSRSVVNEAYGKVGTSEYLSNAFSVQKLRKKISCFVPFIFDVPLQCAFKKVIIYQEGLILNWKYQVQVYANKFNQIFA